MENPMELYPMSSGWGSGMVTVEKMHPELITKGKVVYSMEVGPEHCNIAGNLHGGATSTLVDIITTYALITLGGNPGVTTELNTSFLSAAPQGSKILVEAEVQKAGKSLAFINCTIKTDTGRIVALARHTKHVASL